jgi:hypothetical protein
MNDERDCFMAKVLSGVQEKGKNKSKMCGKSFYVDLENLNEDKSFVEVCLTKIKDVYFILFF